jgi:hypothetical protein
MGSKEGRPVLRKTARRRHWRTRGRNVIATGGPILVTRRAGVAESERAPAIGGTPDFQRADSGDTKAVGSALHHHGIRCSDGSRRRGS